MYIYLYINIYRQHEELVSFLPTYISYLLYMYIYLHHTYSQKETHLCVRGILRVSGRLHSSGDGCHIPCRMARQELQPVSPKAHKLNSKQYL